LQTVPPEAEKGRGVVADVQGTTVSGS